MPRARLKVLTTECDKQILSREKVRKFNAKPGEDVVVTQVKPGALSAQFGINTGEIILQVILKAVNTASDFKR